MSRFQLYRHYDANCELLYVGQSNNAFERYAEHQQKNEWTALSVTMRVEQFESREDVVIAERKAIISERPRFNCCQIAKPRPKRMNASRTMLQPRLSDDFLAKLDAWRRQQEDLPSRTEALRRLVETHPDMLKALSPKGGAKK